jgi:hypothetical protein
MAAIIHGLNSQVCGGRSQLNDRPLEPYKPSRIKGNDSKRQYPD